MRGYILMIFAGILWGTTGTSQALAPEGATPLAVGTIRLLVGGGALLILSASRGEFTSLRSWLQPATLMAGITAALYQLTFFAGVSLTGVAVGTIVAIGSAPIFTGILGYTVRGEKLSQNWFIATGLSVVGCVLLAFSGNETMQVNPFGMLLALGAGLSYALFTLANKILIEQHKPDAAMAVSFSIGALLLLPILFFVDTSWVFTPGGIAVSLHLGILATGLSYMLFGRSLQILPVSTVGTLTLVEPLTASLLGIFLLREPISLLAFVGIATLFAGLVVLVLRPTRKSQVVAG